MCRPSGDSGLTHLFISAFVVTLKDFLKRGVLERSWRTQQNHASDDLVDSHDFCMWTEDTWVVYHWLSLDELWADPANVTVTLAFIRFAGWLSCVGKDKSITR